LSGTKNFMEIVFITGKGGSGKTSVAAGLALYSKNQGVDTLLVEVGPWSHCSQLYSKNLFQWELWDGPTCLREYVSHLTKIQSLSKIFLENKVTRGLINMAPGLYDIAILGKITSGPPRNIGAPMRHQRLIVDASSSGHFSNFILAPKLMAETIPWGPMGHHCRQINQVLSNPDICRFVVISEPNSNSEEEADSIDNTLDKHFDQKPLRIWNKVWPEQACERSTMHGKPWDDLIQTVSSQAVTQWEHLRKFQERNPGEPLFVIENASVSKSEELALKIAAESWEKIFTQPTKSGGWET
jgi:anion-transporting  ArsA/GET3 family ATPase